REQVGHVLGLAASKVDVDQPVGKLGLDSLMAVELRNRIEKDVGIVVPTVALLQEPTVTSLARELLSQLDGSPEQQQPFTAESVQARAEKEAATLSSAQRWMWVMHQ